MISYKSAAACDETILIAKLLISFTRSVDIPGRTDSLNPDGLDLKPRVLYCIICFQIVLVTSIIIINDVLGVPVGTSKSGVRRYIGEFGFVNLIFELRFIRFSYCADSSSPRRCEHFTIITQSLSSVSKSIYR